MNTQENINTLIRQARVTGLRVRRAIGKWGRPEELGEHSRLHGLTGGWWVAKKLWCLPSLSGALTRQSQDLSCQKLMGVNSGLLSLSLSGVSMPSQVPIPTSSKQPLAPHNILGGGEKGGLSRC